MKIENEKNNNKKDFNKWFNSLNSNIKKVNVTPIKPTIKKTFKNPFKTIQENENLKSFYKLNFNGLHFKNNNPDLNLNDLENEFKTLLNDFKTRKNKTLALKNCLNNILKIKYSVSTEYIRSFFNSNVTPKQKENKIRLLKKGFNVEKKSQLLLNQKSYFIWNFNKITYGYNKLDLNENGFNKYLKKNVCIKKIKVLPTLRQQNKRYFIKNYRLFLN